MDDLERSVGLSSIVTSIGFVGSARSTLRRFGQFAPQLMALRNPLSHVVLDVRGEDDTMICARAEFMAPIGVTDLDPLREKRSQSSRAGSAWGDLRARDNLWTFTAGV